MYKLSEDIEAELQKKFQNVHIPTLVQYIFQTMIEKTLRDGSCSIREFGKFVSFRTRSNKIGQDIVRFKFKLSNNLSAKLRADPYLLDTVPVKASSVFNINHEQNVKNKKEQRQQNIMAQKEAVKLGKEKTKSQLATNEILNIMDMITTGKE